MCVCVRYILFDSDFESRVYDINFFIFSIKYRVWDVKVI